MTAKLSKFERVKQAVDASATAKSSLVHTIFDQDEEENNFTINTMLEDGYLLKLQQGANTFVLDQEQGAALVKILTDIFG